MVDRSSPVSILRSASLCDQVSDVVLGLLRVGEFPPGTRITELSLAQRLKVSRTPIREALGRLVQRGLLEHRNSGGYFVRLHSAKELSNIITVRKLLEPPALRMAAEQFDNQRLQALDRAIKGQEQAAAAQNARKFAQAHEEFRETIFGAIDNAALRMSIAQFEPHMQFIRSVAKVQADECAAMLERQREIRDAIAQHKADLAELLWRHYLERTEQWLLQIIRSWESVGGDWPKKARRPRAG
jgi:DNA-binding GntR family transcriptional regulator